MCQHALEQQNPQRLLLLSLQALDNGQADTRLDQS